MLLVFGGLPASGKSTISSEVARILGATYVRVDTIEQGLRNGGFADVGTAGYLLAYEIASDNLGLGLAVVADSVNPLGVTREAWRNVGQSSDVRVVEIELFCSDPAEHRHRVETRITNIEGLKPPTWMDVQNHDYEEWSSYRIAIDTSGDTPDQSIAKTLAAIEKLETD